MFVLFPSIKVLDFMQNSALVCLSFCLGFCGNAFPQSQSEIRREASLETDLTLKPYLIEAGYGQQRRMGDNESLLRFQYSLTENFAVGIEVSSASGSTESYSFGGVNDADNTVRYQSYQREKSTYTANFFGFSGEAAWPSSNSGVFASAKLGAGTYNITSNFDYLGEDSSIKSESVDSDRFGFVNGLAIGGRYALPFGLSFGLEGSLKGFFIDEACLKPSGKSKPNSNSEPNFCPSRNPPSATTYHFLLGWNF